MQVYLTEKERLILKALPAFYTPKQKTKAEKQKELQESLAEVGDCLF